MNNLQKTLRSQVYVAALLLAFNCNVSYAISEYEKDFYDDIVSAVKFVNGTLSSPCLPTNYAPCMKNMPKLHDAESCKRARETFCQTGNGYLNETQFGLTDATQYRQSEAESINLEAMKLIRNLKPLIACSDNSNQSLFKENISDSCLLKMANASLESNSTLNLALALILRRDKLLLDQLETLDIDSKKHFCHHNNKYEIVDKSLNSIKEALDLENVEINKIYNKIKMFREYRSRVPKNDL